MSSKRGYILILLILLSALIPIGVESAPITTPVIFDETEITQDAYILSTGTRNTAYATEIIGKATYTARSYIDFNTTSIPDAATVYKIELVFKSENWDTDQRLKVNAMSATGESLAAADAYTAIGAGANYYTSTAAYTLNNWYTVNLGAAACTDFMSHLAANWFSVGLQGSSEGGDVSYIYSENSAGNEPMLYIYYYTTVHYHVYGVYYENGTQATALTSTLTVYSVDSTDTYIVDNNYTGAIIAFDSRPILISYTIDGGAATRNIYPVADTGNIYVFEPESAYDAYEFTIKDYINALSGSVYLKSSRVINGTEYTIEYMKVTDSITSVALQLTVGKVYNLEVSTSTGYTFDAGYFIPAADTTGTISLRWPDFSQQAQLTYKYVTIEATRPTSTSIQVNVNNTLSPTYNLTLTEVDIKYRNGTTAYYANSTSQAYTLLWLGAVNSTDYLVYVNMTHTYFGFMEYEAALSGVSAWATFPSFSVFGSVGDFDMANFLPVMIMFIAGGIVSAFSINVGVFLIAILAGFFTWTEIWSMSQTFLYTLLTLAALIVIGNRWRRE